MGRWVPTTRRRRGFFGIRMRAIGWGSMDNIKKPKVHKLEGAPFRGRTTGENERRRGERYGRSGASVGFRRKQEATFSSSWCCSSCQMWTQHSASRQRTLLSLVLPWRCPRSGHLSAVASENLIDFEEQQVLGEDECSRNFSHR